MTMAGFIHFVTRLDKDTFSVYNGLIYPSSPFRYLHNIPIERPEKNNIQPTNKSIQVTYTSNNNNNNNNNNNTLSSHPNLPKKKLFFTNPQISYHAQAMSHSNPPLTSTPSSSGTCKYDTHVAQDSTVYEHSTTTSTSSFSSCYDDDEEEEAFIILQATAIKITSFPPTAGAVAKIFVKGKGSGIATTTSQKVGETPVRAPAGPPAFLATPGEALPVFSSERAKRAARSVR